MGAYLLARCYVRDRTDFFSLARLLLLISCILFPFAIIEAVTDRNLLLDTFSAILPSYPDAGGGKRAGLFRVQLVFEHPIHFGICIASAVALVHAVWGYDKSAFQRHAFTSLVAVTAFFSLSSAPMATILLQFLLLAWDRVLRTNPHRWRILLALLVLGYLAIEFGSNQTPVQFYISYFTFDQQTGWYRLAAWEFGTASVRSHPLFGVGYGEWERPSWMSSSSVDNFWLLTTMRYGLPAGLLMLLSFVFLYLGVSRRHYPDEQALACRTAYLIMMAAFFLVGWTVYFWGMAYLWFLLMLGSGAWLLDTAPSKAAAKQRHQNLRPVTRGVKTRAVVQSNMG
jgi:O-antigen ligase